MFKKVEDGERAFDAILKQIIANKIYKIRINYSK